MTAADGCGGGVGRSVHLGGHCRERDDGFKRPPLCNYLSPLLRTGAHTPGAGPYKLQVFIWFFFARLFEINNKEISLIYLRGYLAAVQ